MKKLGLFIVIMMSCFFAVTSVNADTIPTGSSNMSYQDCFAFSDVYKSISVKEGSYYYKYCYRASCSSGVYVRANMVSNSGYRCQNGNYQPFTKVYSDGCSAYTGTCSTRNATYCTRVVLVDCNRTSNGGLYQPITTTTRTTTTTRKTTTTSAKKTSKKTTKKKTTTKATGGKTTTTTKKVIIPTTTTTTTTRVPSCETGIRKLIIAGNEITDIQKNEFTVQVPYGVADVSVKAVLVDENATYIVSGNKGIPDESGHKITILVTAEDGKTTETTTLTIERYVKKSSNCNLANIHSDDVSLDFSRNTYEYTVKIPKNLYELHLEVVLIDEDKQLYEIKGNENLKHKSEIDIEVTAEDNTLCTYKIKIQKQNDAWKYVLIILILLGILGAAIYFFYKYIKKSKGRYKYE